jgi:hypothetical protein
VHVSKFHVITVTYAGRDNETTQHEFVVEAEAMRLLDGARSIDSGALTFVDESGHMVAVFENWRRAWQEGSVETVSIATEKASFPVADKASASLAAAVKEAPPARPADRA